MLELLPVDTDEGKREVHTGVCTESRRRQPTWSPVVPGAACNALPHSLFELSILIASLKTNVWEMVSARTGVLTLED